MFCSSCFLWCSFQGWVKIKVNYNSLASLPQKPQQSSSFVNTFKTNEHHLMNVQDRQWVSVISAIHITLCKIDPLIHLPHHVDVSAHVIEIEPFQSSKCLYGTGLQLLFSVEFCISM